MFFSLGITVVFLIIVNYVAHSGKKNGVGNATLCSLVALVLMFSLTAVLGMNALMVTAAGGICCLVKLRARWFLLSSLAATVAAYALVILPDLQAWSRLKKEYPVETLAARLAHEDRPRTVPLSEGEASATAAHLSILENRLDEQHYPALVRRRSLELLHAGTVQQFIDSPGFGAIRMRPRVSPHYLEGQQQEELPLPQPTRSYEPVDLASAPLQVASDRDHLTAHDDNTLAFLNPLDFGYVRDREHVVGFQPHRFREASHAPKRWHVNRLELVGLLKDNVPVVYLSMNLPRMDELSQASTRTLDRFEKEALSELRRGEDLMIQVTSSQMRMLGSLRATKHCLECHRAQRGELLGAFSYQLSGE